MPEQTIFTSALSRRQALRGAALAGVGAGIAAGVPGFAAPTAAPADWPAVRAMITTYVANRKVANMVAALGQGQEAPEFIADGRDSFIADRLSDADSLYRIYSMTKPITGMAAMMLVDEGKLGLDQPVADFVPGFAHMKVLRDPLGPLEEVNLEAAARPVTIRHLLTHTSGLGYGLTGEDPLALAYREGGLVPGQVSRVEVPGMLRGETVRSLELFADRLAELPLLAQPGTRWSYSVGLDLTGRIIELVSGQKFDAFLAERIFKPCGMSSTWFRLPEDDRFRFTANYFVLGKTMVPIDLPGNSIYLDEPPFPFGGAGLISSPRDYDRFLQMLAGYGALDGQQVMSEAAVRMGTSNLLPDTISPADPFARDYGFGAGGRVGKGRDAGIYGWFGAAGTCGLVNMRTGLRHSLYTQYMPADAYPVQSEFPDAVARDVEAA